MKKTKLLLVDDEKPLLQNLKRILEFEDFDVVTANNGIEGLVQYEKENPDLVICDIMMPDMDGYHFIESLRAKGFTDAPFIFLTAKSEYDDLRMGMSFGADDYLVKPVKSTQLIDAINTRLLRKRQIIQKSEKQLIQIEEGFKLIADQEFFATVYDIIGYLHLLKTKNSEADASYREEYLKYMEKSITRLLSLMGKVRNWKNQQKAIANMASENPSTAIKEIFLKLANETATRYERTLDLICTVNEDANLPLTNEILETLLSELLDNAFKFSEKGNPIVVNGKKQEHSFIISVADCGKTTNADSLIAYKPFYKDSKLPNNDPGFGLGLAIAELIVKSAKGSIEFANNSPCGILVTVEVPIVKES
jgi:DNA-binding response OmpR family regulator